MSNKETGVQPSYEEFKKNPLLYFLFLPLIATTFLFMALSKNYKEQIKDMKLQIEKTERNKYSVDSINHVLYELLGAKKILDSVK